MRSKTKRRLKRYAQRIAQDYQLPTETYYKDKQVVRDRTFIDDDGKKHTVPVTFIIKEVGVSERGVYLYLKKLYKKFHGDWDSIFQHLANEALTNEREESVV